MFDNVLPPFRQSDLNVNVFPCDSPTARRGAVQGHKNQPYLVADRSNDPVLGWCHTGVSDWWNTQVFDEIHATAILR